MRCGGGHVRLRQRETELVIDQAEVVERKPQRLPRQMRQPHQDEPLLMLCAVVVEPGQTALAPGTTIYWPYEADAWEEV